MTAESRPGEAAKLRLFVAVTLPGSRLQGLVHIQDELRKALGPKVRLRWVRPEGIHLTLKFIGEVDADRRPDIEAAIRGAVGERPPIAIGSSDLGSFGDRPALRVLWLGLGGDISALVTLANDIDRALHYLGFDLERRPLAPHLTLARVPDGLAPEAQSEIAAAIKTVAAPRLKPFAVEDVSLMSSKLGSGGARYETLSRFPFESGDRLQEKTGAPNIDHVTARGTMPTSRLATGAPRAGSEGNR